MQVLCVLKKLYNLLINLVLNIRFMSKKLKLSNWVNNSIFESGSNDSWNWIKFSDGTMICTGTKYVDELTLTEHGGGIYKSQDISLPDFPIAFTTLYTCQLSYWYATWASTPVISVMHWGYPTTISAGVAKILCASNVQNNGGYIKILAIGKWK